LGSAFGGSGGNGLGGAIYIRSGGRLTIVDGDLPAGNRVIAGTGGTSSGGNGPAADGIAAGEAMYIENSNPLFFVNAGVRSTIGDDIAGFGNIIKDGPGYLSLTGVNTFVGTTFVRGGELALLGSVTSNVLVEPNGLLSGTGSAGPTLVQGRISPGDPRDNFGSLTINGNYGQVAGSTYTANIASDLSADFIRVIGTASIGGGTLDINARPGVYTAGMRFTVLTATEGVFGTYDNTTTNANLGRPGRVLAFPNSLVFVTALLRDEVLAAPRTFNQQSVGNVLFNSQVPALQNVYNAIILQTEIQLRIALDALSGALHPSLLAYGRTNSLYTGQMLLDQLNGTLERPANCGDPEDPENIYSCGWNAWYKMRIGVGSTSNNFPMGGIDTTSGGLLFGGDRWLGETTRVGVYGGYNHVRASSQGLTESGYIDAYDLGVSGSQTFGPWYLMGFAGYNLNRYTTRRIYQFADYPTTIRQANSYATYDGNGFNGALELGRAFNTGPLLLQPLVGLQYSALTNNAFTESGDGVTNLVVGQQNSHALWTTLGGRFNYATTIYDYGVSARGSVRWLHNTQGDDGNALMQFAAGDSPFMIMGARTGQNPIWAGLGMTLAYRDTANIFFDVNVLTTTQQSIYMGSGGFEVRW